METEPNREVDEKSADARLFREWCKTNVTWSIYLAFMGGLEAARKEAEVMAVKEGG